MTHQNGMLPISVYLRTLNEERHLGDVLKMVTRFSDDIVVVDSGSSDSTVDIARSFGAQVVHQKWIGNGHQKRIGEDACKHDWLLSLDADEIPSDQIVEELFALFVKTPDPNTVFGLKLITYPPHGKPWLTSAVAYRYELYNKTRIRMPESAVWDQLHIHDGMKKYKLHGILEHHSFTGIEHMLDKWNKTSTRRASDLKTKTYIVLWFRIVFGMPSYFLKQFFLRGLWRIGLYGFAIAVVGAFGRWFRDVKMLEKHMGQKQKK